MVFQAALLRAGKQGILKPDAAGYYEQCIGGLDIENHHGVIYTAAAGKKLFAESSDLQRRIRDRALKGELGHPRRGPEHNTDEKWLNRLNDIVEPNVSTYFSKITLDEDYGRNNPHLGRPNMIGIIGRYRPGGAHGNALERDLADPESNVGFSIRAFSIPRTQMGQRYYDMQSVVTFDQVNEVGIQPATKILSATLESRNEHVFTTQTIREAVQNIEAPQSFSGVVVTQESRNNIMQLAGTLSIDSGISKPTSIYYNWNR